ncbi:hypothetical protein GCM10027168_10520 [Streptomyces capparidis]
MATRKVTITLDEDVVAAVDKLTGGLGSRSAFIEAAVADRLERAERAQRAVDWFAERARREDPDAWEQALEAVLAADSCRGYPTQAPRQAQQEDQEQQPGDRAA